jgi:signal transduction histidine kinase
VPTALHGLLDECLAFAQAHCETPGVEVVRAYDAACPEAMLDARELRKAFLNLVLNGLEALGPGGRLIVSTGFSAETRTVTVVVEDTGSGMSEETLSRMFDLFFTTKPQGTGLGMALARSVIDLHAGELAITSTVGKGTRVTVRLPVEAAPAADGADA